MNRLPVENISIYGDILRREYVIPAGGTLNSHKHPYDHLSILYSGEALLTKNGVEENISGPCTVEIEAEIDHQIYAITECRWDCLHSLTLAEDNNEVDLLIEELK